LPENRSPPKYHVFIAYLRETSSRCDSIARVPQLVLATVSEEIMADKKAGKARFSRAGIPNAPAEFGPGRDHRRRTTSGDRRSSPLRRLRKDAVRDGVPRKGALEHGEPASSWRLRKTSRISRKTWHPGLRPSRSCGAEKLLVDHVVIERTRSRRRGVRP